MDTQAVHSTGNPKAPAPKQQTAPSNSGSKATPTPKVAEDSVELSAQSRALADASQGRTNSEQRKLSVTDDNNVVLQVIDSKTQKVTKSVPSEEEIQLKDAIRKGINDITE